MPTYYFWFEIEQVKFVFFVSDKIKFTMGDWQGEQNWSNYNQQDWNQGQVSCDGGQRIVSLFGVGQWFL